MSNSVWHKSLVAALRENLTPSLFPTALYCLARGGGSTDCLIAPWFLFSFIFFHKESIGKKKVSNCVLSKGLQRVQDSVASGKIWGSLFVLVSWYFHPPQADMTDIQQCSHLCPLQFQSF